MILELLAPARTADVGIDAINAGADAIYIGGPDFGARKAAGNSIDDIARLCDYAHRFGVSVFVTFNTRVTDDGLERLHAQMLECQRAGADAFIIRDPRICGWKDITRPLHASTQCSIRTVDDARRFASLGCSRIVLERQLCLEDIRRIHAAVGCEIEFFVHGAICVGYSGECRLSEYLNGRSADCGDCIQACRSRYDLTDAQGNVLVHDKALLSLKDYKLLDRLEDLADAGVCSFKIEGRLKNSSYVRNVVREYSDALNAIIGRRGWGWRRSSFGRVHGGFSPDSDKTFNRAYTQLFIDGKRGRWASVEAPKSMGERIGVIQRIRPCGRGAVELGVRLDSRDIRLSNGDGFAFADERRGVVGFRGDVCRGDTVICKEVEGLRPGVILWRNVSREFEKQMDADPGKRLLDVGVSLHIGGGEVRAAAVCEDGNRATVIQAIPDAEAARDEGRMRSVIEGQIGKITDIYCFRMTELQSDGPLPMMSASFVNALRRSLAEELVRTHTHAFAGRDVFPADIPAPVYDSEPLLCSRYCIRYQLGMCPRYQGAAASGPLFLVNNGRSLALDFDCARCEMTVNRK